MTKPATVYIAVGANLGDRASTIQQAIQMMAEHAQIKLVKASSLIETAPIGPSVELYLNGAIQITTTLMPEQLLKALQSIEHQLGRVRTVRWGARTIDLDIIAYEQEIISTEVLEIPHPRMAERYFVLAPLQEIAPNWQHPVLKKNVEELLARVTSNQFPSTVR